MKQNDENINKWIDKPTYQKDVELQSNFISRILA